MAPKLPGVQPGNIKKELFPDKPGINSRNLGRAGLHKNKLPQKPNPGDPAGKPKRRAPGLKPLGGKIS